MNTENKVALNEKLKAIIDELGDTPFDEPELFAALDEKPLKKSRAVKLALKRSGLKIKDFTAKEIAEFFNALNTKVVGFTLPDGTFKSTPATENFDLPDFEQVEELMELGASVQTAKGKELIEVLTALDELTWQIAGLDKNKLTEWEQQLVAEQIYSSAVDIEKTSMGKQ